MSHQPISSSTSGSTPVTQATTSTPVTERTVNTGAHTVGDGTTDVPWKENVLGDGVSGRVQNVSWGAIFAGVVTFLGVVFLFSLLIAASGLDGSGTGAAVLSVIAVLLGFLAAGGVAGAMAVKGGLIHGFLTWATSIVATVLAIVLLTLGTAGAVGGVLGSVLGGLGAAAGPSISKIQPSDLPTPTAQQTAQAQQAAQQAQQAAKQAADATSTGAKYGFFGLLLGAAVAAVGGLLGSRSVNSRRRVHADDPARPL